MLKIFIGIITAILISGCLSPSPKIIENGTVEATFYDSGKIKTKKYLDSKNKQFGWKETYHETGELKSASNDDFTIQNKYYKSGQLRSKYEKDFSITEFDVYLFTIYYKTGELKFKNNRSTGISKKYYKSGQVQHDIDGAAKITKKYYETGELKQLINDNTNIYKNYDKDGKLTNVYIRQNGTHIKLNKEDYK